MLGDHLSKTSIAASRRNSYSSEVGVLFAYATRSLPQLMQSLTFDLTRYHNQCRGVFHPVAYKGCD